MIQNDMKLMNSAGIILLLLLSSYFSTVCIGRVYPSDSDVYEIDYRGPETHTFSPSPNRGRPHHKSGLPRPRANSGSDTHGPNGNVHV